MKSKSASSANLKTRAFGSWDYLKITILVFATTALWQGMHSIILPLRVLDFIPESEKNTYLGLFISTGLILAMIVQPIVGVISDRSGFHWGRRRPFILVGVIALLLLLPGIGLAGSYAVLFVIYCLMQISSNTVQGPHQGFIPDLVPEGKRGLASGVKGFLEILGGVALLYPIAIFMDKYDLGLGSGWLWLSLLAPGVILLGFMIATILLVKETPGSTVSRPATSWSGFIPIECAVILVATCYFLITSIALINYTADKSSLWLPLAIVGCLLLLVIIATVFLVKELPGRGVPRLPILPTILKIFKINIKAHRSFLRSMISRMISFIKAHRNFLWFLASRLLFFLAMSIIQRFALYFLRDFIGVAEPGEAVFRFSILAVIGMLVVVYPAGRLSDRMGRKPIAVSSALLGALGILIIILSQNYSSILIAAGILGIATGAFSSTNWALATDLVTKGKEARYLGLANMATAGAGALAGFIGPLIDRYEIVRTGLGYQIMLILCLTFFIIGALLLLKVKPTVSQLNQAPTPNP